jgi:hypothetical protein
MSIQPKWGKPLPCVRFKTKTKTKQNTLKIHVRFKCKSKTEEVRVILEQKRNELSQLNNEQTTLLKTG